MVITAYVGEGRLRLRPALDLWGRSPRARTRRSPPKPWMPRPGARIVLLAACVKARCLPAVRMGGNMYRMSGKKYRIGGNKCRMTGYQLVLPWRIGRCFEGGCIT
jgi:hypothetical protein